MHKASPSHRRYSLALWATLGSVASAAGLAAVLWPTAPEVRYLTAPAQRVNILTEVTASGNATAVVTTEVSSQLSGQVAELLADFNNRVRQGQPLARLDARSFTASLREAEAGCER